MSRWMKLIPAALALLALPPCPVPTCCALGFYNPMPPTLRQEAAQPSARLILIGLMQNAPGATTTELTVESVLRSDPVIAGRKVLDLGHYVDIKDTKGAQRFLVFCDVFKGKVDAYRGVLIRSTEHLDYIKKALTMDAHTPPERLRFFFNYLENADTEIAIDAFKEFNDADYKDYRGMAAELPPEKLAGWLRDRNTPGYRLRLYGTLLGHCGKQEHAALLRSLAEDPGRKGNAGMDGVLVGYTMINPHEGWEYVKSIMKDPKKEWPLRYAGLRTARFLHDFRPDLVEKKDLAEGVAELLDQEDIADVAVEQLRKWGCSDMTDRILGLQGSEGDLPSRPPLVRRAVLRFALSFPDVADDDAYVAEQRKTNAQAVSDAEEFLKLEQGK